MLAELLFYPECYSSVRRVATLSRFPVIVLCCFVCFTAQSTAKVMLNRIEPASFLVLKYSKTCLLITQFYFIIHQLNVIKLSLSLSQNNIKYIKTQCIFKDQLIKQ